MAAEKKFATLREQYPVLLPRLYFEEGRIWSSYHATEMAQSSYRLALQHFHNPPENRQSMPGLRDLHKQITEALDP